MRQLPKTLKTILNALAMQYETDYLSDEDKQANLQRVLNQIEQEKNRNLATMHPYPFPQRYIEH
ncbi:MAG: hypothetical protein HZT40_12155 [Candidatus Thiothrix singaporensis]|uniref:Uncharacterized protein n=1 Tax=Candidatus Thiothrix singaporensis TaxID=2799669 RepID=A0A7L6ASW3_9GAMM|nr:MAG: hypothetical protein HZT40_12155 [Candidatus Thiothrix singaporensis]